jgi:hypothetical protein
MPDPWKEYQDDTSAGPWSEYATQPSIQKRSAAQNVGGTFAAFNRGTGVLDEVSAGIGTGLDVLENGGVTGTPVFQRGKPILKALQEAYGRNLSQVRGIEDEFTAAHPNVAAGARGTGMASLAAVPGGVQAQTLARGSLLGNAARGAVAAGTQGAGYGLVDRGTAQERLKAGSEASTNPLSLAIGAGLGSAGTALRPLRTATQKAVDRVLRGQSLDAIRDRLAQFQTAGVRPSLASLVDDSARGTMRAAAMRQTPARELVQNAAEGASVNLPSRMSQQSRRLISPDPRTPDQIREALTAARGAQGDIQFGAVRNQRIPLDENSVAALRTTEGREAIRSAAQRAARSLDPEVRNSAAELNRLADDALDNPGGVRVTVGQAQHISEALNDTADALRRANRNHDASSFSALANAIRGNARTQVPGYDEALRNFEANSRLIDAAGVGEDFMARNTDEFVAAMRAMGADEQQIARAAARRAVERASGEGANAPRVARSLAIGPEQGQRSAALLGQEGADNLAQSMGLEARAVRDLGDIAPRSGSQTAGRTQDVANNAIDTAADVVSVGANAAHGNVIGAGISGLRLWAKTLGMNDAEAEQVARLAITEGGPALQALEQRVAALGGPRAVTQLGRLRAEALARLTRVSAEQAGVHNNPDGSIDLGDISRSTNPEFLAGR